MMATDFWIALPLLLLAVGALVTLVVGAISRNDSSGYIIAIISALGAACCTLQAPPVGMVSTLGLSSTSTVRLFTSLFCLMAAAVLVLSKEYNKHGGNRGEEYPATILFTAFGMAALASATSLLTLFLGLEAMTFGFYILVASDLKREASVETGLKYLLIGALSSAFLAFGIALIYSVSGSLAITQAMQTTLAGSSVNPVAVAGWCFLLFGMAFKLSLVPAHLWTPDVYDGTPAPVTAFLSGGSKGASLLFLLILLPQAADAGMLRLPFWWFALLSMLIGNLSALRENRIRRLLAYSSIAHMGYVALALVAGSFSGYQAAAYYAVAYGVISLAAFGAIAVMERNGCGATLDDYRGRGARNPFASGVLTLALFALAGIPPTAGFTGKFLIFAATLKSGEMTLAIIGMLTVAVSIYYYLRVISALYFNTSEQTHQDQCTIGEVVVLSIASASVVLLGLFPARLLALLTFP
ncbi:MAG: NADH-quinone oxidoreductase subunit N [Desulfuromonadaceae bacterium]|nr:NADH-quinone oxidoreductase subunit N [Desulfuromonadaceae bacterium]MDD5106619.1 NADH-quinone oxidoreductase subunit N [Desulfuromonadaceae bacterium]